MSTLFDEDAPIVSAFGPDIFFLSEVNPQSAIKIIEELKKLTNAEVKPPAIQLWINSRGGDVASAMMLAAFFPTLSIPVHSICTGNAYSAATLIAVACAKRYIAPRCSYMIHQASTWAVGKGDDIQATAEAMAIIEDEMVDLYSKRSKLSAAQVRKMLKRDTYFTVDQVQAAGLVDEIHR